MFVSTTLTASKIFKGLLALVTVALLLTLAWGGWWTRVSLQALRQLQLEPAARAAERALPAVNSLSMLTLRLIPDIETWRLGLQLISDSDELSAFFTSGLPQADDDFIYDLRPLSAAVSDVSFQLEGLSTHFNRSWLLQRALPHYGQELERGSANIAAAADALQTLSSGSHQWLVVLQNSDEIRATGGFMGSYALLHFGNGVLTTITVEDIYDADGQYTGLVPAPPGVQEYLSSNRGLRLPDANWHPDFGQSAEHILQFFAAGNRQNIVGVTAVTLEVGEQLLSLTGPIWLADYQTYVSSQTLSDVLGSHREEFFAGSIQKKQMLGHLLTQMRLKIAQLPQESYPELVAQLHKHLVQKRVLFSSPRESWQELFVQLNAAGTVDAQPDAELFYWVESNVGINKANQAVDRSMILKVDDYRTELAVTFVNRNPETDSEVAAASATEAASAAGTSGAVGATHLNYVNYQRVLVPKEWSVTNITYDQNPVEKFDDTLIYTSHGQEVRQIGFLLVVPENSQGILHIEFTTELIKPQWHFFKQPGLDSFPIRIEYHQKTHDFILETDTLLAL